MKSVFVVPVSVGRERVAFPGVASTAQNGSVPFALYDPPTGARVGSLTSVDTPSGVLGYGFTGVV